jgi:hypothetical protein
LHITGSPAGPANQYCAVNTVSATRQPRTRQHRQRILLDEKIIRNHSSSRPSAHCPPRRQEYSPGLSTTATCRAAGGRDGPGAGVARRADQGGQVEGDQVGDDQQQPGEPGVQPVRPGAKADDAGPGAGRYRAGGREGAGSGRWAAQQPAESLLGEDLADPRAAWTSPDRRQRRADRRWTHPPVLAVTCGDHGLLPALPDGATVSGVT